MKEKNKGRKFIFYILAVLILLVFLHFAGALHFIENPLVASLYSHQGNAYAFLTKLKYSFINYQEAIDLQKENQELKSQINQLLYENVQLESYKNENESLRQSLEFFSSKQLDYVMANVMGKDVNKDNTLIINKGSNHGIRKGFAAVVDEGIIIGIVIDVKDNSSTVLFLTDNLSQVAASVLGSHKTTGLARGEYGLSIRVDLIPQNLEIKENDLIITSGLEGVIPRGLILGKVNRITSNENDLFKSVIISPLVDYSEIIMISVIIPKDY